MRPAPSRFPILRPPPARLVLAVVLALLAGAVVHRATAAASARAAELGELAPVAVAQYDLEAGDVVGPGDVALLDRPVAHLPDGFVGEDPTGRTVRTDVAAGEVVVAGRLAGEGRDGPAALVPEGWRAIAIPVVDAPLPARPGDVVDVLAAYDPSLVRDPTEVVAADAVVVDVADDAITVAVSSTRLTDVAHALANGYVTLALVG